MYSTHRQYVFNMYSMRIQCVFNIYIQYVPGPYSSCIQILSICMQRVFKCIQDVFNVYSNVSHLYSTCIPKVYSIDTPYTYVCAVYSMCIRYVFHVHSICIQHVYPIPQLSIPPQFLHLASLFFLTRPHRSRSPICCMFGVWVCTLVVTCVCPQINAPLPIFSGIFADGVITADNQKV